MLGRLRDVVLVVAGADGVLAQQPLELVVVEAGQLQVEALELQVVELEAEEPPRPIRRSRWRGCPSADRRAPAPG